ncbi:MAG: hypothetical protein KIT69_07525 [Propionibacteriaceae bacterium]|nr:hypothetical protein [Propionibacteriaceae bacterium]
MHLDLASKLDSIVLYQIYPQSFADSNGDGIGDLAGIRERLDYLAWLGVDALWLNPCFLSPFADAGYDVSDFLTVAPRYGTNEDLEELCGQAAERGIAVLLDLVAGHTSDQHPWFLSASRPDAEPAIRHRYIWSETSREGWHAPSGMPDAGWYLPNFFPVQPALNYGYARPHPDEPWRQLVGDPGPQANRAALREIMAYWFGRGVSGFRVDMAASLVKDDPGLVETGRLWRDLREWIETAYPGRILVAEWGDPAISVPAGFHADFLLQFGGADNGLGYRSLLNNNAGTVDEVWQQETCWADANGSGDAARFVQEWQEAATAIAAVDPQGRYGRTGIVGLPTANHDFTRLVAGPRDLTQAAVPMTMILTWPALPSLYYGDEIGMRYVPGMLEFEGSRLGPRYDRAGSRTPMQWGELGAKYGPGTPAESRYLPSDPDPDAPTAAAAIADPDSYLYFVRRLIARRRADPRLHAGAPIRVLATGYPLAYTRGEDDSLLVVLNPSGQPVRQALPDERRASVLLGRGVEVTAADIRLEAFGYAVLELTPPRG